MSKNGKDKSGWLENMRRVLRVRESQQTTGMPAQSCEMSRILRINPCKKNLQVGVKSLEEHAILQNKTFLGKFILPF